MPRETPRPYLEDLEPRLLLTATVAVVGNDLVITGTDAAETVQITKTNNDYTVAGDVTNPGVFTARGRLRITMAGGADRVEASDVFVGDLESATPRLADLIVDMGDGDDHVGLEAVAARNATIRGGEGDNNVEIFSKDTGEVSALANLRVDGGAGSDTVGLYSVAVGRNVDARLGGGRNSLSIQKDIFVGSVNSEVLGSLLVRGDDGVDVVTLADQTAVLRGATLRLGNGDNRLNCTDSNVLRSLTVPRRDGQRRSLRHRLGPAEDRPEGRQRNESPRCQRRPVHRTADLCRRHGQRLGRLRTRLPTDPERRDVGRRRDELADDEDQRDGRPAPGLQRRAE